MQLKGDRVDFDSWCLEGFQSTETEKHGGATPWWGKCHWTTLLSLGRVSMVGSVSWRPPCHGGSRRKLRRALEVVIISNCPRLPPSPTPKALYHLPKSNCRQEPKNSKLFSATPWQATLQLDPERTHHHLCQVRTFKEPKQKTFVFERCPKEKL